MMVNNHDIGHLIVSLKEENSIPHIQAKSSTRQSQVFSRSPRVDNATLSRPRSEPIGIAMIAS